MALVAAGFVAGRGAARPRHGGRPRATRPLAAAAARPPRPCSSRRSCTALGGLAARGVGPRDRRRAAPVRRRSSSTRRSRRPRTPRTPTRSAPTRCSSARRSRRRPAARATPRARSSEAVLKFPGEPQTWYRLAAFQLGTLDQPRGGGRRSRAAIYLDPQVGAATRRSFLQARARAARASGSPARVASRSAAAASAPRSRARRAAPQRAAGEAAQVRRERVRRAAPAGRWPGVVSGELAAGTEARGGPRTGTAARRARARRSPRPAPGRRRRRRTAAARRARARRACALGQPRAGAVEGHARHVGRGQLGRVELRR